MSRALIHHHFVSQATGKYAIGLVIHNFRKLRLLTGFAHVFASTSPSVQLLFICAAWHAHVCQERIAPPRHDRPLLLAMEVCSRCSASTPMPSCYAQLLLPAASRADLTRQSQHAATRESSHSRCLTPCLVVHSSAACAFQTIAGMRL